MKSLSEPLDLDDRITLILQGQIDHYKLVVERCEPAVRAVLAVLLPDNTSVDDLTYEVFLTAYQKLSDYRAGTSFVAWLRTIARNLALNERRRSRRSNAFLNRYRESLFRSTDDQVDNIAGSFDDTTLASLRACVDELAPVARTIVQQHYYRDTPCLQIATEMARPPGWVRVVLHRARTAISQCLKAKGLTPTHG